MSKIDQATKQAQQVQIGFMTALVNSMVIGAVIGAGIWFFTDSTDQVEQVSKTVNEQPAVPIEPVVNKGAWQKVTWVDEFGDETGEHAYTLTVKGNYDNMFVSQRPLRAVFYYDTKGVFMRFNEDGRKFETGLFETWYYCHAKTENGTKITGGRLRVGQSNQNHSISGDMISIDGKETNTRFYDWVKQAVKQEQTVQFVCSNEHQTTYRFKLDFTGFNHLGV